MLRQAGCVGCCTASPRAGGEVLDVDHTRHKQRVSSRMVRNTEGEGDWRGRANRLWCLHIQHTRQKNIILTLISVKVDHFSLGLKTVPEKEKKFFSLNLCFCCCCCCFVNKLFFRHCVDTGLKLTNKGG